MHSSAETQHGGQNEGGMLKQTKDFVYLGEKVSDSATSDGDIDRRIGLATGVAGSLTNIWKAKYIGIRKKLDCTKHWCSRSCYTTRTWTLREALNHKLRVFEMTVLRCIRGVTHRDR